MASPHDNPDTRSHVEAEIRRLRARIKELERPRNHHALDTVSVPRPFEDAFIRAQQYVERYFAECIQDPRAATISISGERYVLVRAASMSVEFFDLVMSLYKDKDPEEARSVANNLLFDMAHAIGKADAKSFHARMGVVDPIERLSAGPIHFSFSGWAFVKILPESSPSPDENYFLIYDHPFSFESDSWRRRGRLAESPVCIMNAGYSSGWCEESFGLPLVALEVECQARGDANCRFIMAPPRRLEEHVLAYLARTNHPALIPGFSSPAHPGASRISVPEFFQRKRMEDALRASHQQLEKRVEERTAELAAANRALQAQIEERTQLEAQLIHSQKMESIGRLAGGIAHDFNNLLTAILGYVDLIEATPPGISPSSPIAANLSGIREAAGRAADLTRHLLTFARRQIVEPKIVGLNTIVLRSQEMLRRLLGGQIEIVTLPRAGLPNVRVDPGQMEQVLMNLAVNARDAMPDGGRLSIETALAVIDSPPPGSVADAPIPPGEYVLLTVSDTGSGMTDEVKSRIFEPFFTTKGPGQGTGLGLATCYGIVTQSGGRILVESESGRGTKFLVYLPSVNEPADEAPPPPRAGKVTPRERTILLVEDEQLVRGMIRRLLAGMGFTVLVASDAIEALEIAKKHQGEISVLLTDVVMPRISGMHLSEMLRQSRPNMRVIFMSGYTEESVAPFRSRERGVRFLPKPFTLADIVAKLEEVLNEA